MSQIKVLHFSNRKLFKYCIFPPRFRSFFALFQLFIGSIFKQKKGLWKEGIAFLSVGRMQGAKSSIFALSCRFSILKFAFSCIFSVLKFAFSCNSPLKQTMIRDFLCLKEKINDGLIKRKGIRSSPYNSGYSLYHNIFDNTIYIINMDFHFFFHIPPFVLFCRRDPSHNNNFDILPSSNFPISPSQK